MSGWRTMTSVARHDVVHDVAVDGRPHLVGAALEVAQEPQQATCVVALGEALALHQPALGEHGVGVQEPVGGHEVDLRVVRPAGQQRLQDAGERALADGHAAGDADHVRHARRHRAEERRRHAGQVLGRADVQVEQARQRQVDRRDLVEVDALVDAAQLRQVVLAQGQRGRRAQRRPVVAAEREEPAPGLDHTGDPTLGPCPRCNPSLALASSAATTRRRHWLVDMVVANTVPAGVAGRHGTRARPGVRRRPLPRRRRPPAARRRRRADLVGIDIDADAGRRRRAARSRRSVTRVTWRVEHGDALAAPWGGDAVRRRRRQPAVPVAAGGGDDARRRQPPRRRPVRRRRGRVPRPRRAPRPTRRRPDRARAAAVDPRLARRRGRARRARPAGDDRRGRGGRRGRCSTPRCSCARWCSPLARPPSDGPCRALVERRRHRRARRAAAPAAARRRARSATGPGSTANFRDQYYGLVPAVDDGGTGPPLVTSGLVDPGRCAWGRRDVTFAKRRFRPPDRRARPPEPADAPLGRRAARAQGAVANQTRVIEAVADPDGAMAAGRPADHRPTGRRRRRLGARGRAHVAGGHGVGLAPRRRHRAVGARPAPRPALAGRAAVAGRRARARPSPRFAPATSGVRPRRAARRTASRPTAVRSTLGVVGRATRRTAVEFPAVGHTDPRRPRGDPLPDSPDAAPAYDLPPDHVAAPVLLGVAVAACGGDDAAGEPALSPEATEGRQIAARAGCAACHGSDGDGGTGPAWTGTLGTEVELDRRHDGHRRRGLPDPVDRRPGRPGARRAIAIEMPQNQLTDEEIAEVVAYIVALNGHGRPGG